MYHITDIQEKGNEILRRDIFPSIISGNTILFLGAGASITDNKVYLSSQLMNYHKAESGNSYQTDSIIDYVDVLSRNPQFDRKEFDDIVEKCLRNLEPTAFHTTIARLPWKEIITTNLDIIVEKAFDKVLSTSDKNRILKPVKNLHEYHYNPANDEIKYIKLNGCISDRTKYPFIFSTRDFESVNGFYKIVLQALEHMSPRIQFLVIGYSFRDPFAKFLLDRFDRYNYRNKRDILLVDPTIQEDMLPYLESSNIRIIQCTASEFYQKYEDWEESNEELTIRKRKSQFRQKDNSSINISNRLINRLGSSIVQINSYARFEHISPEQFYTGERPSYFAIKQDYDVIRLGCQKKIINKLEQFFNSEEFIIPIVALTGSYGVGKTTFCYRLVHSIINSDLDVVVFEVLEPQDIREIDLRELISAIDTENVVLLFDECEVDSFFKAMIDLRSNLSIQQLSESNIVMLVPIRENILQKLTHNRLYPNLHQLEIDTNFNKKEALDLIKKLDDSKIISVRDERGRRSLASTVVRDYKGDAFVSLLSIVTNGHHDQILRSAYEQLSEKAKESFIYTSLLYRFKILMPSSLLMKLVSKDWSSFKRDVIEYDAKGILVQEEKDLSGDEPDLYFRTRHSVISDLLIKIYLNDSDKRFAEYQKIFKKITYTPYNSRLIINVLKAMITTEEFTQSKIDTLFDICANEFSNDPHFNLHYAINLQYRRTQESLELGIKRIIYAEGFLDRRNHRLTHRRAVLNFRLAQLLDHEQVTHSALQFYIDEARELFQIKMIEDPFSIYSFLEYLRFEIWYLETFPLTQETKLRSIISIENLLDRAKRQLHEGIEIIAEIEDKYRKTHHPSFTNDEKYINFMSDLYKKEDLRPYALILYFYYYSQKRDKSNLDAMVRELEQYAHLDEVSKLLFRYYGSNLHHIANRTKLFDLARSNQPILEQDPIRYHYFLGVAEAYNRRFHDFWKHMKEIRQRFGTSLRMQDYWKDDEGNPEIFDAVIVKYNKKLNARIINFQHNIPLFTKKRNPVIDTSISSSHKVQIQFYAGGMKAFIVQESGTE